MIATKKPLVESRNVWPGWLTGAVRLELALFAEQGGLGGDVGFLVGFAVSSVAEWRSGDW